MNTMDIKHYFIEKGQGEPLVLLHGNGENCGYFAQQLESYSQHYHVYALDTRGHGKTPRGDAPFSISQFADDLKGFFYEHGIERAHVLGFSDGANIAMVFTLRYPQLVDRLILNGGNLHGRGVKLRVQLPIILGYKIASFFAKKDEGARANAEMLGLMVNDPALSPSDIAAIRAKTLVIAGSRDMIKESHTRLIASSIPGARLEIIDGDHFIAANKAEIFDPIVLDFLASE